MALTTKTWTATSTLNDVINAIVDYIDKPNIDEPYSRGSIFFSHKNILLIDVCFYLEIGDEYLKRRADFDRKAKECVQNNMVSRE